MHLKMLSAICFNLDQSKILLSGNGLNLYPTIPSFHNLKGKELLETVGGKGAFSHTTLHVFRGKLYPLSKIKSLICKLF